MMRITGEKGEAINFTIGRDLDKVVDYNRKRKVAERAKALAEGHAKVEYPKEADYGIEDAHVGLKNSDIGGIPYLPAEEVRGEFLAFDTLGYLILKERKEQHSVRTPKPLKEGKQNPKLEIDLKLREGVASTVSKYSEGSAAVGINATISSGPNGDFLDNMELAFDGAYFRYDGETLEVQQIKSGEDPARFFFNGKGALTEYRIGGKSAKDRQVLRELQTAFGIAEQIDVRETLRNAVRCYREGDFNQTSGVSRYIVPVKP